MSNQAQNLQTWGGGPSQPADPLIGQVLDGRYQIEKVLGKGGMGLVYKSTHVMLRKKLAIKVLRSEVSSWAMPTRAFFTVSNLAG